jgi:hypothetical protein
MGSLDTIGGTASSSGAVDPVSAPSPTSEAVAAGASFSAKTFGSFTDSGGRISSYAATTTNASGSTSWSGSGLGGYTASGSADGDAGTLSLTARDSSGNDLATATHTFERATASAGGWTTKGTHDITGAANAGPYTSGAQTVDATGGDIGMTATRASGNSGNVTITNGTGAVITAVGGSGAMTATFDLGASLSGYDLEYIRFYALAVDVYITNIVFDDDGSIAQVSISDNTAWNDGDGRGLELYQADASDEQRRIRGAGSTTSIDTRTKVTERVVTLVMTRGQIVDFLDTSGTTAPSDPHTASPLYTAGGDAVGRNDDTPLYISNFYCNVTAFGGAALTVTKVVVRRFQ